MLWVDSLCVSDCFYKLIFCVFFSRIDTIQTNAKLMMSQRMVEENIYFVPILSVCAG